MPVIAWGNGGCIAKGTYFINFLINLASHGFVIAAPGEPEPANPGQSDNSHLVETLDWAARANAAGQFAGHLDPTKLAVAGQSCGGVEATEVAAEEGDRLTCIGIFNSGLLSLLGRFTLRTIENPIAYFLGGPDDIAYRQGERDYDNLPRGVPAWKGNLDVGHFATFVG
jgi:dienelactone hydrolase